MVKFTAAFVTLSFLLACSTAVSGGARKARYAPSYNRGDYEEAYDEPADYKFAWHALATGPAGGYDGGAYGGGGYGQEPKYGGAATAAQFGHTESRYGDQTQGKYFVQLPNGLLQTVDYKVDDNSGYVATVSYSDGAAGGGYAGEDDAAAYPVYARPEQ